MRLNVTPAERDDLTLALRSWIADLEEPLFEMFPTRTGRALARRRRQMARRLDDLAGRIGMADLIPMPETTP